MKTTSKNQESRKRPPTQEEFWREQKARPDFQSLETQEGKSLPPIVPFSYPITQPKPLDPVMDTQQTSDQPKRTSTTTKQTERDADSGSVEEDRQKGWEAQESMKAWLMSLPTGGKLRAI